MPTLILSPRHSSDSHALRRSAIAAGWEIVRLSSWSVPDGFAPDGPALFGEWLFCGIVADALGLTLFEPAADALPKLPQRLRKRDVTFSTLGDARRLVGPRFLKPAVEKAFPARVYDGGSDVPDAETWPDDMAVLSAEPVTWEVEFRCFVRDGQVVAVSPYWRDGELAFTPDTGWETTDEERSEALAFAGEVLTLADAELPPAVVLDVGRVRGKGWAVVEFNPASGSGIYGCDPDAVLPVLARACGTCL